MKKKILIIFVILLMITVVSLPATLGGIISKRSNISTNKLSNFLFDLLYKFFDRFPNAFPTLKYNLVENGFFDRLVKEGTGTLVMELTDAPPELNITEALVNISRVSVHYAGINGTNGTWITVVNESQTFELISLQDVTEFLGGIDLIAGWYTQIRLSVDSALLTIDSVQYDLEIPSRNIKLNTPFLVQENETVTLTLDFDVQKSVHKTGNDKYKMNPTIKVIQEGSPSEFEADAGGDYEADVNETIQFNGTAWGGVEPYTWFWDFGDDSNSTEQDPQHAYAQEGEYEVILTVTDATNQVATDHTEAKIGEEEEEFEVDAGGDYEADVNETIQFNGTAWGGVEPYTWFWDFGDDSNSTEQDPQHAYAQEGEYEVILTVTDATNQVATDHTEAKIGEDN